MKAVYFIVLILMVLSALLFAEWNGIFALEGALAGIGLAVAVTIQKTKNPGIGPGSAARR